MNRWQAKVEYLRWRALGAGLCALPEPAAALAAGVVGTAMARRGGAPLAMRELHMRRILAAGSPVEPDPLVVRRWARRSYRSYARYWVEGTRLPDVEKSEIHRRLFVERGYEQLQAGMAAGRGVLVALPHVGSWEWGGAFLAIEGYPMTSVAEVVEPPELYEWFLAKRRGIGLTIVPLDNEAGGVLLRTLRSGGLVGLVADRDIEGHGIEVEFFGEKTTFPAGPATLALRTGAMLLSTAIYSGPGPHHFAEVMGPLDTSRTGPLRKDVARLTQELAAHFEHYIRRAPEQWHLYQPNWPSDPTMAELATRLRRDRRASRHVPRHAHP